MASIVSWRLIDTVHHVSSRNRRPVGQARASREVREKGVGTVSCNIRMYASKGASEGAKGLV